MSGQRHAPAALTPEKSMAHIAEKAGLASGQV